MKIYVSTYYRHRRDGELYQTYAEIDSGRREIRKVGTFAGGRGERVGVDLPNSEFALRAAPIPDFVGYFSAGDVFLEEISGDWFEELWGEASTGAMGFIDDEDVAF
ncbi:DUF6881 domain-containing protein [Actinoplanes rectilineatus]|uniref:DUF6881 domain-containing protein n=1 Tax=Actinoplanes rectilineatus TaxID=113571 RepID=UPI0005F2973C|nr:hypothetical protein [Actinoplanes rectilineatus]